MPHDQCPLALEIDSLGILLYFSTCRDPHGEFGSDNKTNELGKEDSPATLVNPYNNTIRKLVPGPLSRFLYTTVVIMIG